MTRPLQKRLINVDEYHRMAEAGILGPNDRVELILGEILNMSPIGSKHSAIVKRVTQLFVTAFLNKAIVQIQDPIQIKDFSEPEPDILLLKQREDFYYNQLPQPEDVFLLIEVADSTLDFDKNVKLPIYSEAGIKEYWIVDINNNQILIHSIPEGKLYKNIKIATASDHVNCSSFPNISIAVKDILG